MTHSEKVACFEGLLRERGFWIANAIPPATRLLWRLGFKVPPPYFLSFWVLFFWSGGFFGVFWSFWMWLIMWRGVMPVPMMVVIGGLMGVAFGLIMAINSRRQARRLGLPAWDVFPEGVEGKR
ncbi:MAG: DUF6404 family protein [Phycisphaeraceae bacterium]